MAAAAGGIDIRKSGSNLIIRASLKDSNGAKLTTGTTTLKLLELQDDGTFKTFEWHTGANQYTFQPTVTTDVFNMTHQQANSVDTGVWTLVVPLTTGLHIGAVYVAQISNSGASPVDYEREFQYGGMDGDVSVVATAVLAATVDGLPVSTILLETRSGIRGVVVPHDNHDGTFTLDFKRADGTTTAFSIVYNPVTGARS